jgi:hypothetical protein
MRRLLLGLLFILPFSVAAQPVMTAYKPKLVIFIIHGFLGGNSTFCDLKEVLEQHLGRGVEVEYLSYPTKGITDVTRDDIGHRNNVDIPSFTRKVFEDISEYFRINALSADQPYAIITHSQGGLIASRLLLDCYEKGVEYCTKNLKRKGESYALPTNLTHFFSIMTPFWGSPTASYVKDNSLYRYFLPKAQVRNLSIGSDFVTYNRSLLMESYQNNYEILKKPEIINIAANASSTWLGSLIRGISDLPQNGTLESDIVVPIPSARMDFLYYDYSQAEPKIGKTEYADYFYALNGNHINVYFSEDGLACVRRDNYLKTPIFPIIRKHLAAQLQLPVLTATTEIFKDQSIFPPDVESFILELQLEIPKNMPKIYNFATDDIQIVSKMPHRSLLYKLHRSNDLMSSYLAFNQDYDATKSYVTYFTTGAFLKEYGYIIERDFKTNDLSPREPLQITINTPWFKSQVLDVEVSPSYTTYAKIKLIPKDHEILPTVHLASGVDGAISIMQVKNKWRILSYSSNEDKISFKEYSHLPFEYSSQNRNTCYLAKLTPDKMFKLHYYKDYDSLTPFPHMNVQQYFNVFGRVTKGRQLNDGLYELDRVFVTSYDIVGFVGGYWPHRMTKEILPGMWMNTKDVRLMQSCN